MRSMTKKTDTPVGRQARRSESGMALIMALLALFLLTAVGLTLALSTSTEVQVAANYRWSLQALYNAEAGLEVAKTVLRANTTNTATVVPMARKGQPPWDPALLAAITLPAARGASRNYEMGECDRRGNGIGYGTVMNDTSGTPLSGISDFGGQSLNGQFTVWGRRPLIYGEDPVDPTKQGLWEFDLVDHPAAGFPGLVVIIVSEGVAPGNASGNARQAARQAVQVVEATIYPSAGPPVSCGGRGGQSGKGPGGANAEPCVAFGGHGSAAAK